MLEIFKAKQIVCIQEKQTFLYGEIIQVIVPRKACWLRPLMLMELLNDDEKKIIDLRETSDLVLPEFFLRAAFDTEVIPLLIDLNMMNKKDNHIFFTRKILNNFIQEICQRYPEAFKK